MRYLSNILTLWALLISGRAELIYENLANNGSTFYPGIPGGDAEFGDELELAGTARTVTQFEIEYYGEFSPTGNETVRIRIYANDGTDAQQPSIKPPGTRLYESEPLPIYPGQNLLTLRGLSLQVPNTITWSVTFGGLNGFYQHRAGPFFYDPPTVGSSFDDFWEKVSGQWQLMQFNGLKANFGARVVAVSSFPEGEPLGDLQVAGIQAAAHAQVGDTIAVSWTLTNAGPGAISGTWSDRIWLLPTNQVGGYARLLATQPIPQVEIAAGGVLERSATLTLPADLLGKYWLVVEANEDGMVAEACYTNNLSVSEFPLVISTEAHPNLRVVSVVAPPDRFAGQETMVQWAVTNNGTCATEAAQWRDAVYLSQDPQWDISDQYLGSVTNWSDLNVGGAYRSSLVFRLPTRLQGTNYLIVRGDVDNQVDEGGVEDDNLGVSRPIRITVANWPDLQVSSMQAPAEVFSGTVCTLIWTVTNAGTLQTEESAWWDRIYLSTNLTWTSSAQFLGQLRHEGALAAGQAYSRTQAVTLPFGLSGTDYHFLVVADQSNEVWEHLSENNNVGWPLTPMTVNLTPPPDLAVTRLSIPASVGAGAILKAEYAVANVGAAETPNLTWQDGFYLSADTTWDPSDIPLTTVPHRGQLLPGESYSGEVSLPMLISLTGSWYVIVVTDVQKNVFELDTNNNQHASANAVNLLELADLTAEVVSTPASALAGFTFAASYRVHNAGPSATLKTNWTDAFFLSPQPEFNPLTAVAVGTATHSGVLAPNDSYESTVILQWPVGRVGPFYLVMVTDPAEDMPERNETNNSATAAVPITGWLPANDLAVVSLTSGLAGFDLTLSCVVTNQGPDKVPNRSWRDTFYLSRSRELDSTAFQVGEVPHGADLMESSAYTNQLKVTLSNSLEGNFYVLVLADSGQNISESNKTNNQFVSLYSIAVGSPPSDLVVESGRTSASVVAAGSIITLDWMVRNVGAGRTSVEAWKDAVVLSVDGGLTNADNLVLDQVPHYGGLESQASYQVTNRVVHLPAQLANGPYRMLVRTDTESQVYEGQARGNNAREVATITVVTPSIDLVPTVLAAESSVIGGGTLVASWRVMNQGANALRGATWVDSAFLVPAMGAPILLGSHQQADELAASGIYTVVESFKIPVGLEGQYHVKVQVDSAGQVSEWLENNNDLTNTYPVTIQPAPTPDLLVVEMDVPAQAVSGQPLLITWAGQNLGATTATPSWNDAVYLSRDTLLDRERDYPLGYVTHSEALNPGSLYRVTNSFDVPSGLTGTFYVIVETDSRNEVYERLGENNNTRCSPPVTVEMPPLADLVVTAVNVPAVPCHVGQRMDVTYTVLNQSANVINGRWEDTIYLSLDGKWDIDDPLLEKVAVSRILGPWQSYTGTLTAPLPGVAPGSYYVLVRTDIRNQIAEADEDNNLAASTNAVAVDMVVLSLGMPYAGQMVNGSEQFYQVNVPGGEVLAVSLSNLAEDVSYDLLSRQGKVPTLAEYDYGYSSLFQAGGRLVVPESQAGYYYNLLRCEEAPNSPAAFQIQADLLLFGITGVAPARGGNSGRITLVVNGARLTPETVVSLNRAGVERISFTNLFVNPSQIRARFDLRGLAAGRYDVVVEKGGGERGLAAGAFEVIEGGGPNLTLDLLGPSKIGVSQPASYFLNVRNCGINDLEQVLVSADAKVAAGYQLGKSLFELGMPLDFAGLQVLELLAPSETVAVPLALPVTVGVAGPMSWTITASPVGEMPMAEREEARQRGQGLLGQVLVEQRQWEERVGGATSDWGLQAAQRGLTEKLEVKERLQAALRTLDTAVTGLDEAGLTGLRQGRAGMDFAVLQAVDPNELLGPEGFGPLRFVGVQRDQFFQVNFENSPAATAYSHQVEIVDALPAELDARTIELKDIRFGSYHLAVPPRQSFYQNRIRLGPELNNLWAEVVVTLDLPNRTLRWRLTALDPATGMMPTDPHQGLLPPNDSMQNGRGSVTFTARARSTYATGTRIQNQALIVFDNHEPLETSLVWNTLDTGMPASAVLTATNVTEGGDVTLTWDGADDSGGSGIKSYDIYVSDNGGPYQQWLTEVTARGAIYPGQVGHVYNYYSRAWDNAVNYEMSPEVADAQAGTAANRVPVISAIGDKLVAEGQALSFAVMATDPDMPPQLFRFSLEEGAPAGMSIDPVSGTITWTPTEAQGPSTNVVTVWVSDNGVPSLSATNRFTVMVNEVNTAPVLTVPADQTLDELTPLNISATATDGDFPANTLAFGLVSGPNGLTVDPGSGAITWTPTEAQGPSTNVVTVRVSDNGVPSLSATNRFTVMVNEVNTAPVLTVPADQTLDELTPLNISATATDGDFPANTLAFGLVSGPNGLTVDPGSGAITWTPTEAQGPSTNVVTVWVSDNGVPSLSATNSFTVMVNEVNTAPVLTVPADQTLDELTPLNISATATDGDFPANTLAFGLVSGPNGLTVDPGSGAITWTPTEAQGPSTNVVTVRVSDNGVPSLSATNRFTVMVNEVNTAPVLTVPADQTLDELTPLNISATATDGDFPANTLAFGLVSGPNGLTVDPGSGAITWTPTEAQGPSTNVVTVRVSDNGVPSLSATNRFTVMVNEVNTAPVLTVPADQTLDELTPLNISATATDGDFPANTLTFGLVSGPNGMTVDPGNGAITWTPTEAQGPSTNVVTVWVSDNGVPSLSATNSFTVMVNEVNTAPVLTVPADQTLDELTPLNISATATDGDFPANTLAFGLVSGPNGLTVDPGSGAITWTPTEAQGPSTNVVTVRVSDNGVPSLSATNRFTVMVNEVNTAPVLTVPADQTLDELTPLNISATATDGDFPANTLAFGLVSGPNGLTVDPGSGAITWTPTEAQGPSTNVVTVWVSDNGVPSLSATNRFTVVVRGARKSPTLFLDTVNVLSGGEFRFRLSGNSGDKYVIQKSGNLIDWTGLQTNTFGSDPVDFSEPRMTNESQRFFRVLTMP